MAWIYHQYSGDLYHDDELVYRGGYSGKGSHKNNPASEGCIIVEPKARSEIIRSVDRELIVE
ncbi:MULTISPECIES: hypothetical protein [Xenorhabdus]|uniref:hypothetical protein n=1 Tax=Xenorhabdus TaxID=626 RepID=UPI00064B575E|nr:MULTISPECIES: hypothetical protein [Xenorhabdus]KLU17293.1 hypothetical protein AAY47_01210 [Xenorhabdus griffiniae]KOP33143.1 hypothetical protein AFK69_11240 [Xenorhabdus sp. GDc328]